MTTSVPSTDEALLALVRRCVLVEDPVPAAVVDRAEAAFEQLHAVGEHLVHGTAGAVGPGIPGPRPWGGDQGFL